MDTVEINDEANTYDTGDMILIVMYQFPKLLMKIKQII